MKEAKGIWFVYRSHYEGPLSKRVRRLKAPSVLAWFQSKFEKARSHADPHSIYETDLGGYVYGFGTVFEAVKQHSLVTPKSTAALGKLLKSHLYVEGASDNIRLDDHTLRVATDDDEVSLAYFFFDDEAARDYRDRIAYLLQDDAQLPDGEGKGSYEPPMEIKSLLPRGDGQGVTYVCLFTFYDGQSIPGEVVAFQGVRLPELASHLRAVVPVSRPQRWSADWLDTWPVELRLLRAMLYVPDHTLSPALLRCGNYPLSAVVHLPSTSGTNHSRLGAYEYANARNEFLAAASKVKHEGKPEKSLVHEGNHVAILCAHALQHFGYQQWIFFDDLWAAAYPDLATSLLHYGRSWDPFRRSTAATRSPEETAAARQERAWKKAMGDRLDKEARTFNMREGFAIGELIRHPKFGIGIVQRVELTKITVMFQDATRTLAHEMK